MVITMALKEISLTGLVDMLDEMESEYADFFRPMLGYEAILTLYDGIADDVESQLVEIEDETGYEFPPDLVAFYMCSNGGVFGDLKLFPLTNDKSVENTIHKHNVIDLSLKESIGLDKKDLLIGHYPDVDNYVFCSLKDDGDYTYKLWDSNKKKVIMEFEYLIQIVALEVSYVADYDGFTDFINSKE
jgi:hypothetical protein